MDNGIELSHRVAVLATSQGSPRNFSRVPSFTCEIGCCDRSLTMIVSDHGIAGESQA